MHQVKRLSSTLRELLSAVEAEAEQNPKFAATLEAILGERSAKPKLAPKKTNGKVVVAPDVMGKLEAVGEDEFAFWLRTLDVPTLKSIVRANGYDPQKRSQKWTDPARFVALIADQTIARRNRGSAFLKPREGDGA